MRNGYWTAGAITSVTLLAEGLNIVVSGVPYATGQTWQQFLVSTYMSIAILGIMIIVSSVVIVSRLREPCIPRKPDTLGGVMSYLSGSRTVNDFDGLEGRDDRARDRVIWQMGKIYKFSKGIRDDGKVAWKIDETY